MSRIEYLKDRAEKALVMTVVLASVAVTFSSQAAEGDQQHSSDLITSVIKSDIDDAERIADAAIDVKVTDGLVELSGTVSSLLDKQLAARIAKRTRGVKAVVNQILVEKSDRSDEEIRADVEKVLNVNDGVDRPQIAVNVSSGEVATTGKVDSLAEKRIAEFAVSGVRGVTSVDNQLTVALSSDRPDRDLRAEIKALIVHSVYLDDVEIEVQVDKHVAKLSGTVRSAKQKEQLERVAEIWGISAVDVSDVMVDPDLASENHRETRYANATDRSITDALRRSFAADPIVFSQAERIKVAVNSGQVTLTGDVSRLRIKRRAEQLAGDVVGVRRVNNQLDISYPDKPPTDLQIIDETLAAISRSAYLDQRELRVHCQQGHVSLYGIVESELEKQVAEWIADGVDGVVHVNNALAVEKKWKEKSDEKIQADLQRKLKYSLFDASNRVDVTVENGVAILRGEVDTWRQWQAVMDLALEAGARHPHNLINVRYHPPHGASRIYVPQ